MKTLKQLLELTDKAEPTAPVEPDSVTSYVPKTKDEKRFMDKHVVQKTADANKNGDDLFRGSNIKAYDRSSSRHGYNTKDDQKVYESKTLTQILGEKHLTPAEMKKREEIAQAMERDNPGMDKSKKMAIATAQAKKVAEEVDQIDELSKSTLGSYVKNAARDVGASRKLAADFKNLADKSNRASQKSQKGAATRLSDKFNATAQKRHVGIGKAIERLTKEEVELDEAARHDQYNTYHAGVKDMLKKIGAHVDAHKEATMAPTEWNKEKGGNTNMGHVYAMKNLHRSLQDMHDNLQQDVEYAQPPKPMKMKEEADLFDCFADDVKAKVEQVFEQLSDDHKQIVIEMIEAEEYDELVNIVDEVLNG